MKKTFKRVAVPLFMVLIGTILTAKASADCGFYLSGHKAGAVVSPQSWRGAEFGSASLLFVSEHHSDDDSIVGFWKVTFTAEGNGKEGPPDDTVIDSAYVQWHRDGTEIMNSGRPPQNGDICLGVWEKTGRSRYKLNHFANGNVIDPTNPTAIGPPGGPTQIVEDVVLSRDGKHYAGTFVLDAYDTPSNGNKLLAHIIGVITATRITVDTPVTSVF
jgi:hypothetical protein